RAGTFRPLLDGCGYGLPLLCVREVKRRKGRSVLLPGERDRALAASAYVDLVDVLSRGGMGHRPRREGQRVVFGQVADVDTRACCGVLVARPAGGGVIPFSLLQCRLERQRGLSGHRGHVALWLVFVLDNQRSEDFFAFAMVDGTCGGVNGEFAAITGHQWMG